MFRNAQMIVWSAAIKRMFWALFWALCFATPTLVSPRLPPAYEQAGLSSKTLIGPLHITVNPDSAGFLVLAKNPRLLLDHSVWQSRPGYVLAGWAIAQPLTLFAGAPTGAAPEFLAYLFLNWLLLAASLALFASVCRGATAALLLPITILGCNEVTKAFLWTPHLQIFNVFIPVGAVLLNCWVLSRPQPLRWLDLTVIGLALGLGSLFYGAFAVPLASAGGCLFIRDYTSGLRMRLRQNVVSCGLLALTFLALPLAWMAFVRLTTGSFYAHEIAQYRQFVWISDTLSQGTGVFRAQLSANMQAFLATLASVLAFPLSVLAGFAALSYALGVPRTLSRQEARIVTAVLAYGAVWLPFFGAMGFYATRLTWTIVPPALVILFLMIRRLVDHLSGRRALVFKVCLAGLALGYVARWTLEAGPYG